MIVLTVAQAAECGDVEVLRALLDTGGDPNEPETEEHFPPLLEAAYGDHVEAARLLLDAGADMYKPHSGGETPLLMAGQRGSLGVFRLLLERGYVLAPERDNAAYILIRAKHIEIVRYLLAQGIPVNSTDFQGCTALTYAAHGGRMELIQVLLEAGADVNHRDNDGETVLMWAADHTGNAAALRALLAAGADVNAQTGDGGMALDWTVWAKDHGDAEMARVLLEAGADPNGSGALRRAAYFGFTAVVRLLLEHGAEVDVTDAGGKTALDYARERGHREIADLLRAAIKVDD